MAGNFEWQTEEESRWDELPPVDDNGRPPRKRRWWMLGLVLLLIVATGGFIFYQVNQRIEAATAALKQDVFSSVNLVRRAAAEQDGELFVTLLSGRDLTWTDTQRELFKQHMLLDRATFGFTAAAPTPLDYDLEDDTAPIDITFSPELDTATVTLQQPYTITRLDGTTASVMLEDTAVYRRSTTRWLMSPPDAEFWGNWVNDIESGAPVDVIYRTRDEDLVQRLRTDLIPIVESLCTTLEGITCPAGVPFVLRFSDDPAVLLDAQTPLPIGVSPNSLQIDLPTPTLIGVPVDDTGYDALLRSYGRLIASAYIALATEYDCCTHAAFYQGMLNWQLARLGLRDWPITAETYAQQRETRVNLDNLNTLWNIDTLADLTQDELQQTHIAVEFLHHALPDRSIADLQRTLSEQPNFQRWLSSLRGDQSTDARADVTGIINEWTVFLFNQGSTAVPADAAYPTQDIQLSCFGDITSPDDNMDLTRYRLADATAVAEQTLSNLPYTAPLPDDSGIVVLLFDQEAEQWNVFTWVQGAAQPIREPGPRFALTLGQSTSSANGLVFYESEINNPTLNVVAIDLANCDDAGCQEQDLPGMPTWSPDGSQVIYTPAELFPNSPITTPDYTALFGTDLSANSPLREGTLVRTSSDAPLSPTSFTTDPTARGYSPFWLDNNTYGYLTLPENTLESMLIIADATSDVTLNTVTIAQLQSVMPDNDATRLGTIAYAQPNPAQPEQIALVALSISNTTAQIFLYDLSTNTAEWRLEVGLRANQSLGFSPDGRYLVATGARTDSLGFGGGTEILVHDIDGGNTAVFPAYSEPTLLAPFNWSADGQWLAFMMDTDALALVNPALSYAEIAPVPGCSAPNWINQ